MSFQRLAPSGAPATNPWRKPWERTYAGEQPRRGDRDGVPSAPDGAHYVDSRRPHDLRRGLTSNAASRLPRYTLC
jgi:hypothetical protein